MGHFTPYTQHSCPSQIPGFTAWPLDPYASRALAPPHMHCGSWGDQETSYSQLYFPTKNSATGSPFCTLTLPVCPQESDGGAPQKLCLGLGAKAMSLSRPGETEPIHSVSYGHVAACQLMGPHTLALRVGESQILLQSPQVSGKEGCGKRKEGKTCQETIY